MRRLKQEPRKMGIPVNELKKKKVSSPQVPKVKKKRSDLESNIRKSNKQR